MKLVSRFKDYYDGLRGVDLDPEPVYVREQRILPFVHFGATPAQLADRRALDPLWTMATAPPWPPIGVRGVVGFCARIYPFYVLDGEGFFTMPDLLAFASQREDHPRDPLPPERRWRFELRAWHAFDATRVRVIDDAPFRYFDAPILLMTDQHLIVNPLLNTLGFGRLVDPYTAWQDISVFLGNNLVKNRMTARPVSDDLKAHAHGFDKHSFKKTKTGRKKSERGEW